MNCRNFAEVVGDLVRSELPSGRPVLREATVEDGARAHAATCSRCGNRLTEERELAKGLQLVSRADLEKSALIDEVKLRSAYRASRSNAELTIASPGQFSHAARFWWGLAVAACVTLLVGGALLWRAPEASPVGPISRVPPTPRPGPETRPPVSERFEQIVRVREPSGEERGQKARTVGTRVRAQPMTDAAVLWFNRLDRK